MDEATIARLREATEDDVRRALLDSQVLFPLPNEAAALSLFNRLLDVLQESYAESVPEAATTRH